MKWKSKLLSSGIPLEFEISKILVKNNFNVTGEYCFRRIDETGNNKDFSIDLDSYTLTPNNGLKITSELNILAECKYRINQSKWLFLPIYNNLKLEMHSGNSLTFIHSFAPFIKFKKIKELDNIYDFEQSMKHCYKGIEIKDNNVFEAEINHGISQLKFALVNKFIERLGNSFDSHIDDNIPFTLCPILVTNADLHIAKNNFSIDMLKQSKTIDDISKKVKYLQYFSPQTPEFRQYALDKLRDCLNKRDLEYLKEIESAKQGHISEYDLPFRVLKYWDEVEFFPELFSQFIICNDAYFNELIVKIKKDVNKEIKCFKRINVNDT